MEDLFDTIMGHARKRRRQLHAKRKQEMTLAGKALTEALGGSGHEDQGTSPAGDPAWYDLDHAIAATDTSGARTLTEDDYEPGPLEVEGSFDDE